MSKLGRGDRGGAYTFAVANGYLVRAVLRELIHQSAGQHEVEEAINFPRQVGQWSVLPRRAPENSEHLDVGKERASPVTQMR
jgi:hypothetical protein